MAANPDVWYSRYTGAYARKTMHLTTWQHGAYTLLMDAYYVRGKALPDNDQWLASVCKATAVEWRKNKAVLAEFFVVENGVWWHERCERELAISRENHATKSAAGRHGNEVRWGRKGVAAVSQSDGKGVANAVAEASQSGSQNDPPSPSPSPTPLQTPPPGGGEAAGFAPSDAEVYAFAAAYGGQLQPWPVAGPIPPEFVATWLKQALGRREFPPRWTRHLTAAWVESCKPGAGEKSAEKTGVSANVTAISRERKLAALRRDLAAAQELADSVDAAGADTGEWEKCRDLEREIRELEGKGCE